MNKNVFGKIIKGLRISVGFSQKDLAEKMGEKRTTISAIELGRRKLFAEDLLKLIKIFNVNLEYLLGESIAPEINIISGKIREKKIYGSRVDVPQKNIVKFKEVLLYILKKVGAKPNIGMTVIYKLLYFIDFDYYEMYEEQLIGAVYIKNQYGPSPVEFKKVIDLLVKEKRLEVINSSYFKYPQNKYLPLAEPDLSILSGKELELIDRVIRRLSDMNAKEISEYSHRDVPWLSAESGKTINYESVFYRTNEYSVRHYKD